jgi:hypothetical protein
LLVSNATAPYELWSAAGCQRRCDGETETLKQQPCVCPADKDRRTELAKTGSACKPITRLNVMLPDLPDLGVWLLSSTGWNAATELGGAAEVLAAARDRGVIIPATLRLEQRETRKVGEATKKYAVPVLEIGATLRQMTELASGQGIAASLPPAPPRAPHAINASSQPQALESARGAEAIEAELVEDAQDGLDEEHAAELQRRIEKANFHEPYIPAMEKQIKRWADELLADQEKAAPF